MRTISFAMICLACLLPCSAAETAPPPSAETPQQKLMESTLAKLRSNWDRLQTGEYRCTGKEHISTDLRKGEKGTPKMEGAPDGYLWGKQFDKELTLYSAFDFPQSMFRFDTTERRITVDEDPVNPSPVPELQVFLFAQTRDARMRWSTRSWAIEIDRPRREIRNHNKPVLDIRTLPVAYYRQLHNLELPFAEWWSRVTVRKELLDAALDEEGRYRLRWGPIGAKEGGELFESYTIWFDSKRSCVPVRMEVAVNVPNAKPSIVTETIWTEIGEIWLPSSFHAVSYVIPNREELHLSFEWKSVNKPIDAEVFSWKGFEVPPGTRVVSGWKTIDSTPKVGEDPEAPPKKFFLRPRTEP